MAKDKKYKIVGLLDICSPKQWKTISIKDLSEAGYSCYSANGKIGFYKTYNHEYPTLLIGCRGTCGSLHITEPFSYTSGNAMALDSLNRDLVDIKYLFYFLKQRGFGDVISGSSQPQITRQGLRKIKIPLPTLEDQKRIVKILDRSDALRQKRKQAIGLLDDYLKSVFLEMFGDPVKNPKGWGKKELGKIADSRLGKMRDKQYITGKYLEPYLGNSNVKWFRFDLSSLLEMDFNEQEKIKYSLNNGDLLICEGGDIGRCAIWRDQLSNCFFQKAIHRVRTDKSIIIPEYLQWVLWFYAKGNAFKESRSQATIAHLTGIKLKRLLIPIAKLDLQNKFAGIVDKSESIKQKMLVQSDELENQFQALMQKAFKGEL